LLNIKQYNSNISSSKKKRTEEQEHLTRTLQMVIFHAGSPKTSEH
jgi:hypothetical protein